MCSITPETANVGSSYNRMRGPGIGCWFSDRSNCSYWSLTLTFTLTSENLSLYTTLLFLLVLIQLCSPRCWYLDSNYCRTRCRQSQTRFVLSPLLLHLRLLGTFQSDIPLFTLTWPAKHSPNQGWESTHTQVTPFVTPWVVSLTPPSIEHWIGGPRFYVSAERISIQVFVSCVRVFGGFMWTIDPYPSRLLHWYRGNATRMPVYTCIITLKNMVLFGLYHATAKRKKA